ncbi:MAG TPA: cysteine desulfurase family protein [Bacteroidales bacterium]|nr:cysteine desulfurase family protein [Bacteroidales bacterium]
MKRIYLDNAATTSLDPEILDAMVRCYTEFYGNASSLHSFGTKAREILDHSRATIAASIGANPEEIFFTSGGTEANNMAVKGIAFANRHKGNHIIVSSIEHDCILNACKWLETQGFFITYIPVDSFGTIDRDMLRNLITPRTILVSVMYANNEIGTIQPVEDIGKMCRELGIPFHSDACQAYGKMPINVTRDKTDLMTINAHKIYGPKGVGALYVRKGISITPLLHGGGQENGLRASTENIPGIAGFAKAVRLFLPEINERAMKLTRLQKLLSNALMDSYDNVYILGHPEERIPGHLSFSFHGLEGETMRLLLLLDEAGIAVSAGSACSSNDRTHTSHVLQAIGLNQFEARGAIRISMGKNTTENDIRSFIQTLSDSVKKLNSIFTY